MSTSSANKYLDSLLTYVHAWLSGATFVPTDSTVTESLTAAAKLESARPPLTQVDLLPLFHSFFEHIRPHLSSGMTDLSTHTTEIAKINARLDDLDTKLTLLADKLTKLDTGLAAKHHQLEAALAVHTRRHDAHDLKLSELVRMLGVFLSLKLLSLMLIFLFKTKLMNLFPS
jgi:hypothetical protein